MNSHPISAWAWADARSRDRLGQVPGEIWDHFGVEYEYPNGVPVLSQCRHWPKSDGNVSEFVIGTNGTSDPGAWVQPTGGQKNVQERAPAATSRNTST